MANTERKYISSNTLKEDKKMWREKLEEIVCEEKKYGNKLNKGANEKEIQLLIDRVRDELQFILPEEYINILKVINGLEYNGFILYGIDEELLEREFEQSINGLIDNNQVWYDNEWEHPYIFLGDSSISWYVYDTERGKYYELDKPSGREMKVFSKLEDLLDIMLSDALL